jgi:hypothetical protein
MLGGACRIASAVVAPAGVAAIDRFSLDSQADSIPPPWRTSPERSGYVEGKNL